jgi:hypothetical protein
MKLVKYIGAAVLGFIMVAGVAHAAPAALERLHKIFAGGITVASAAAGRSASANKVQDVLAGSATVDFASVTDSCTDSTAITVTGAAVGDRCMVGTPAAPDATSFFMCYVSAADSVKVRHCAHGTVNPASGSYTVTVVGH